MRTPSRELAFHIIYQNGETKKASLHRKCGEELYFITINEVVILETTRAAHAMTAFNNMIKRDRS